MITRSGKFMLLTLALAVLGLVILVALPDDADAPIPAPTTYLAPPAGGDQVEVTP